MLKTRLLFPPAAHEESMPAIVTLHAFVDCKRLLKIQKETLKDFLWESYY